MNALKISIIIGLSGMVGCGGGAGSAGTKQATATNINQYAGTYLGTWHNSAASGTLTIYVAPAGSLSAILSSQSWTDGEDTLTGTLSASGSVNATLATSTGNMSVQGNLVRSGNTLTGNVGNMVIDCIMQ